MGLDQYAWKVAKENAISDLEIKKDCPVEEIYYWRKVPNLQGWMENLYREKGGTKEFNCDVVKLTEEDLDELENAIKNDALPDTEGPFFGKHYVEDMDNIVEFIYKARKVLRNGDCVYYSSWW